MGPRLLPFLTAASLAINALLALTVVRAWPFGRSALTLQHQQAGSVQEVDAAAGNSPVPTGHLMAEAPRLDWSEVESADFMEYARKLRQAGFPPAAARDALLPEILTHYAKLVGEQAKYAISPRWAGIPEETQREHRQAWERLAEERKHLVELLFGTDPEQVELYKPWAFGIRQQEFPALPDDLREHLEKLKHERTQAKAALVARGLAQAEVTAGLEPLIRSQEAEMRGFLPQDVYDRVTFSR